MLITTTVIMLKNRIPMGWNNSLKISKWDLMMATKKFYITSLRQARVKKENEKDQRF